MTPEESDEINDKIATAFGSEDKYFANHPLDEKKADEAFELAREKGMSIDHFRDAAIGVAKSKIGNQQYQKKVFDQIDDYLSRKS